MSTTAPRTGEVAENLDRRCSAAQAGAATAGWGGELSAAEAFAASLRGERCRVFGMIGGEPLLPARRWLAEADDSDRALLARCVGATVDIGCGPGRMTQALLDAGVRALGIDLVKEAVQLARQRGAVALQRDVFSSLPAEGAWDTALLADGNIGIGGDPVRLLRRVSVLLAPGGRVVTDLAAPGGRITVHRIGLEVAGQRTPRFPWAVVPADQLQSLVHRTVLVIVELANHHGRWFATLGKRS